ncbi:MAG: hypothetical protein HJJLKODD_02384 [Phycisphaerae bacterium]|nr:hypothetical protein [Phycisphaerae bacterium]
MELLLGDEAVALAAVHAGIRGAFSYPGTPATEILEAVQQFTRGQENVSADWSANEKVAYEEALGMSFTGYRALVSMKHVGLNVAADPFMSSALTGAHGGLVLAVADDPGMHSSQNEQDSRYYGHFAKIPILEPSTQQEAYDLTWEAFELSEKLQLPVMIRMVTRLAHSRANVQTRAPLAGHSLGRSTATRDWTLLPVNARRRFGRLLQLQDELRDYSAHTPFNRLMLRGPMGIIATGLANNYVLEALPTDHAFSLLKIGVYPPPLEMIRTLVYHCENILVAEEGYPYVEEQLLGLMGVPGKIIRGRTTGALPAQGELNTDLLRAALQLKSLSAYLPATALPARPPQLCQGCPHCDTFKAIVESSRDPDQPYLFSDIGCYTLGALPPFNAVDTCVDMGASISMALGAAKGGAHPVMCTIGDSTFIHSGITPLIGAIRENANMTVVILDNSTTGMTGGQDVLVGGKALVDLVLGLGMNPQHLVVIEPLSRRHDENMALIRREIDYRGLSVIIAQRECIQTARRPVKEKAAAASPA